MALPAPSSLAHGGACAGALVDRIRHGTVLEAIHSAQTLGRLNSRPAGLRGSLPDGDELARALLTPAPPLLSTAVRRGRHARRSARSGLRVVQLAARGSVDAGLRGAGQADGGGVVTLVVQLARALGARPEIEHVVTLARGDGVESLGPAASVERLELAQPGLALRELWHEAPAIEAALTERLRRLAPDVLHLRFADVATLAGARAARRLGIPVVFTLAPDPHALLAGWEERGLTRGDFAAMDASERYLLRIGLVDALVSQAAALVELPRGGGRGELERLLGVGLEGRPVYTVPEGIDVEVSRKARADVLSGGAQPVLGDLRDALAPERRGLPFIVSVGRLDPIKGMPRLVSAWAGEPALREGFNLVVVGGDLEDPSALECAELAAIERELAAHPEARGGCVLLGNRTHADTARLLAAAHLGVPGVAAPHGIYACASAKEEFGVALLEALAAGLPVVAPDTGGPPSYVEDGRTGILVRPGTVESLRAGLVAAQPLRADRLRVRRARDLIEGRYAVEAMAAGLVQVYADVACLRTAA